MSERPRHRGEAKAAPEIVFAGRACRLPGARTVAEFRDLLFEGRCAVSSVPEERWRHAPFLHPRPGTKGKTYTFAAGVVEDVTGFDPDPFGLTPREADLMDPQQRLLLQVTWEALEDAGLAPSRLAGDRTGVYVGASMMDHGTLLASDPALSDGYMMTGSALSVIANRISHVFGFGGPSMTIDTACSSALFALEAAMHALRSGRIDTAIVGATNVLMSPANFIGFAEAHMLSPTGLCRAFSSEADGYVRGEGAVAFVLRRLEAGNGISPDDHADHGRLVHVTTNSGAGRAHIALPSVEVQARLLSRAYEEAGIDPDAVAFVEAHGTGTPAGDPVEAEALARSLGARRARPLPIGSVKSNIGHLEPAAGVAGLLKALIALEAGRLPASLHSSGDGLPEGERTLSVTVAPTALSGDFAGVSAFGFGGANAHAIVARAPARAPSDTPLRLPALLLSAHGAEALRAQAAAYQGQVWTSGRRDDRLLSALIHRRARLPDRLAVLACDPDGTEEALAAAAAGRDHPLLTRSHTEGTGKGVVFLFSGNGAQHPAMSAAGLASSPEFRVAHGRLDRLWTAVAGWSLADCLEQADLAERLSEADVAQPLLFADQVAMARALIARGAAPSAVLGHSGGELAAAAVAGVLPDETALRLLLVRSRVQAGQKGAGAMAAVQAPEAEVRAALAARPELAVTVAAVNSPVSVTVSGPVEDVAAFRTHARRGLRRASVPLRVDYAFHHALQDPLEAQFRGEAPVLSPQEGDIAVFSSVLGREVHGESMDADYWWRNIRRPVRFADALEAAAAAGHRLFVEIGPDAVLGGYVADTLPGGGTDYVAAVRRADPVSVDPVAMTMTRLLALGAGIEDAVAPEKPHGWVEGLRTYPWQNRAFRIEDSSARIRRKAGRDAGYHPLLGCRSETGDCTWTRDLDRDLAGVLADHRIGNGPVLPGAVLIEMMLAAGAQVMSADRVDVHDLQIVAPVRLASDGMIELRTSVCATERTARIESRPRYSEESWRLHARGRLRCAGDESRVAPRPDLRDATDGEWLYLLARQVGLDYGPGVRCVRRFRRVGRDTVEVELDAPSEERRALTGIADPMAIDATLHAIVAAMVGTPAEVDALAFVPVRLDRVAVSGPGRIMCSARLSILRRGARSILVDVDGYDAEGTPCLHMRGLRLHAIRATGAPDFSQHSWHLTTRPIREAETHDPRLSAVRDRLSRPPAEPTEPELLVDAAAIAIAGRALCLNPLGSGGHFVAVCRSLVPDDGGDLPDPGALLDTALREDPTLAAEVVALRRLMEVLPDLWAGHMQMDPDIWLGSAAVANLEEGAAVRAARARLIAAAGDFDWAWADRGGGAELRLHVPPVLREGPMPDPDLLGGPLVVETVAARPHVRLLQAAGGRAQHNVATVHLPTVEPPEDALARALREAEWEDSEKPVSVRIASGRANFPLSVIRVGSDGSLADRMLELSRHLAASPDGRVIVVLLPGGGPEGTVPAQVALWSFFRVARNEYPALRILTVDHPDDWGWEEIRRQMSAAVATAPQETEIVLSAEGARAIRVVAGPGQCTAGACAPARLRADPCGGIARLAWEADPVTEPAPGEVQVRLHATGLNFRDVLWAMGTLPEEAVEEGHVGARLGMEATGTVTARGAGVDGLPVGSKVVLLGGGLFAGIANVSAEHVMPAPVPGPPGAGQIVAYLTAEHALHDVGQVRTGETVLIHGGAGGVGLAAIEVARRAGARIIATAGSPAKQAFVRGWGADVVLPSRDGRFAEAVRGIAPDGVDIVLNALSGDAVEESLSLLAPFGRFVEIGKQDLYADTRVGLRGLRRGASFHAVDIDRMLDAVPHRLAPALARVGENLRSGRYRPLPCRVFASGDVEEAFRTMQRSEHVGRVVVRAPEDRAGRQAPLPALLDGGKRGWLVIAGAGGLAHAIAERHLARGSRWIALLGRSETPSREIRELIGLAGRHGAEIRYTPCDVADREALHSTLSDLRTSAPVAAIVHAAMALYDRPMAELDREVLDLALAAKVRGLDNFDCLTRDDPVESFVVCSSIATLAGTHGQAAYAAANGYMEGVIRRRRAEGLPGFALGLAAIGDAGHLARSPGRKRLIARFGGTRLKVREAARAFDLLAARDQRITDAPTLWIGPFDWAAARRALPALGLAFYGGLGEGGAMHGEADLADRLLATTPAQAEADLIVLLREEIGRILRLPVDAVTPDRELSAIGVDSLMAVELALSLQDKLGEHVLPAGLNADMTPAGLSAAILRTLGRGRPEDGGMAHAGQGTDRSRPPAPPDPDRIDAAIRSPVA